MMSRLAHFLIVGTWTNGSFQSIEVHVNCLKAATAPFLHMQPSSSSAKQPRNDSIPWIGTTILVLKVRHPMKGYQAIVKSVLCKQLIESGLHVVAQLTHLDPSSPYKTVVLDWQLWWSCRSPVCGFWVSIMYPFWIYDCYRFRCKLFDFGMPQSKLFIPLNQDHMEMQMPKCSAPSSSGNMTPMPDWSPSSLMPAWDSSSWTPMPTPSTPSWTPLPSLMASHDPTPTTALFPVYLIVNWSWRLGQHDDHPLCGS